MEHKSAQQLCNAPTPGSACRTFDTHWHRAWQLTALQYLDRVCNHLEVHQCKRASTETLCFVCSVRDIFTWRPVQYNSGFCDHCKLCQFNSRGAESAEPASSVSMSQLLCLQVLLCEMCRIKGARLA